MPQFLPTRDNAAEMFMALLPPGRAFQRNDFGGVLQKESVIKSFLYALAGPWTTFETAMFNVIAEYNSSTTTIDYDQWLAEYNLPDDCDPFGNDLVARSKQPARVGTTITYYKSLAEALGYVITARWLKGHDGEFPGVVSTLHVVVDSNASPVIAHGVMTFNNISFGAVNARGTANRFGVPSVTPLICSFLRILPAHCDISYQVI